ncbi:alginate O-acetyltransferase AlgX-related protein [Deinococcus aquiradiocola]|uniref:AlgX/AlgJ SGNH hydrolase-like domain-containing protein n=1 Tax=Deinococcus aquiradiocola TaxID=393059 RepID=A0A917P8R3_9DEIO|nr:hypothetical protein [Deinococcus aquiradiocola]GGJ66935.1 hypothetical protein GCM10008939_08910 [Deinococcus aquiradiocola]
MPILNRLLLTAALLSTPALAASTPADGVPAACGQTLDRKAWMFQGQGGWFYYGDELSGRWTARPWAEARAAFVPGAARLAAALRARGVQLVVAPVPPRSFVVPGHLNAAFPTEKAFDVAGARAFYQGLVGDLRAAGIPTADLLTPAAALGDAGVFRQDIHWTPQGAQVAAHAVADTLRQAGRTPGGTPYVNVRAGTVTREAQAQPVLAQLQALCGLSVPPETFGDYQSRPDEGLVAAPGNFGGSEGSVRWAFGPVASVTFLARRAGQVTVNVAFENPVRDQRVDVVFGRRTLDTVSGLQPGANVTRRWTLDAQAGSNTLEFRFADHNGGRTPFAPGDGRPLAAVFRTLTLSGPDGTADLVSDGAAGAGLLGGAADTVLVGASSSLPNLNFAGFLQEELGTRVDNVSFGGAGVYSSLKDYLLDPAFTASTPKTLIWQIPLLGGDDTAESDLRFLTAAARSAGSVAGTASGTGRASLDVAGVTDGVARVHVNDAGVKAVTVKVTAAGGTRTFEVSNSERMTHRQEYLLDLSGLGRVTRVEASANGPLTLSVTR